MLSALILSNLGFAQETFTLVGLLHDDSALNRPHDVELQGDVAYVPGKGGSLALIDISDVRQPTLLSSLTGIEAMEDAETVMPMGDILIVGTRDFLSVDVSDPRNPVIITRISDRPRVDKINGMVRRGDRNDSLWASIVCRRRRSSGSNRYIGSFIAGIHRTIPRR